MNIFIRSLWQSSQGFSTSNKMSTLQNDILFGQRSRKDLNFESIFGRSGLRSSASLSGSIRAITFGSSRSRM